MSAGGCEMIGPLVFLAMVVPSIAAVTYMFITQWRRSSR